MFNKNRISILIFGFIFCLSISSQSKYNYGAAWDNWNDWRFDFSYDRPFIEVNYGFGNPKHDKFYQDFAKIGLTEIKLGYLKESDLFYDNIDDRKESFVFGSMLSPELKSADSNPLEFETEIWRFGFATRHTLGYYGDSFSVLPYHQDGFVWSRLETSEKIDPILGIDFLAPEIVNDHKIIERYKDAFRFGTIDEGGIRFELMNTVSINAGYEASVIFPRHLFWKQAGSYIIQKAGQGALTYFINEIFDSTPVAAPIISFLLQNGYAYAFHLLKQKDMNWPFETEAPLTYETFKLGITFTF